MTPLPQLFRVLCRAVAVAISVPLESGAQTRVLSTPSPVAWHRAVYDSITRAQPRLTKVEAPLSALAVGDEEIEDSEGLGYTVWCEAATVRAIRMRDASEHSFHEEHFYFAADSLVFLLRTGYSEFTGTSSERLYFTGPRLVRWLGPGNAPQPLTTPQAREIRNQTLDQAKQLLTAFHGCRVPAATRAPR